MRVPPFNVILGWPLPNYVDPPTRGPAILYENVILTTFLVIIVGGRFYARIFVRRLFGMDDWMMVPAFIFSVCMAVVVCLAELRFGWDRHLWDVAPWMYQDANIIAFVAKLNFTLASTFTRLSLICFYYRLIKDSGIKWFKWVLHASIFWTACVGIVFVSLTIWLCQPVQCYWVWPPMENCHCLNEGKTLVGGGVANCFTDALVTLLPIPVVMRLQMPLRQRIGICFLLSMGILVTIAGAVRTYYSWKGLIGSWDETWWTYPLWIAATIEIELAAMCACAPAWKSLLSQPLSNLSTKISSRLSSRRPARSSSNEQNNNNNGGYGEGNKTFLSPIRSLPWFQLKSLRFTTLRSLATSSNTTSDCTNNNSAFEKGEEQGVEEHKAGQTITQRVFDRRQHQSPDNRGRTRSRSSGFRFGAAALPSSRDSDILEDDPRSLATLPLRITIQQSIDQASSYDVSSSSGDVAANAGRLV